MKIAVLSILCGLIVLTAGAHSQAKAMDFVAPEPKSLAKEVAGADVVVVGLLYDGDAQANGGGGTTEVAIQAIIKDHPGLENKKHFTLNRYVPAKDDSPTCLVLFGALVKGEVDAYRGVPCSGKNDELVTYLKSVCKLETASTNEQFHFYFDHLDYHRPEIAQDACRAFREATYNDLKSAAEIYDQEKLKSWIADDKVPKDRKVLYKILLVFSRESAKQ